LHWHDAGSFGGGLPQASREDLLELLRAWPGWILLFGAVLCGRFDLGPKCIIQGLQQVQAYPVVVGCLMWGVKVQHVQLASACIGMMQAALVVDCPRHLERSPVGIIHNVSILFLLHQLQVTRHASFGVISWQAHCHARRYYLLREWFRI
jgi:hypothetical protein